LVNAAFWAKGVLATDGLVELHAKARHRSHAARRLFIAWLLVDLGLNRHDVVADLPWPYDLFPVR